MLPHYLAGAQEVRLVTFGYLPEVEILKTTGQIPDGIVKSYYDNGALMETMNFKNNARNGLSQEFYPNGQLLKETKYLDNVPQHSRWFDEEGNLRIELSFNENASDFKAKYFDEHGELLTAKELKAGNFWLPDFQKIKRQGK